jgi:hypothetical protein
VRYRTIVADPPWRYTKEPTERTGGGASAEHQYATMATEEIAALPVAGMADDQAHLYLWVTNPVLLGGRRSIRGQVDKPGRCVCGFDILPQSVSAPISSRDTDASGPVNSDPKAGIDTARRGPSAVEPVEIVRAWGFEPVALRLAVRQKLRVKHVAAAVAKILS